jgi:hypothetical protein
MKLRRFFLISMTLCMLIPLTAFADGLIDFTIPTSAAGTLSYSGGTNSLVGAGITVNSALGVLSPSRSGVGESITNGSLNFTSGPGVGSWKWGAGGAISVIGGIPSLGLPNNSVLLSGTFSGASLSPLSPTLVKIVLAGFSGIENPNLLSFYGYAPGSSSIGSLILSPAIGLWPLGGNPFSAKGFVGGTILTSPDPAPVPIPSSLLLFVVALFGLALAAKFRIIKSPF